MHEKRAVKLRVFESNIINFGSPAERIPKYITNGISIFNLRTEIRKIVERAQRLIEKRNKLILSSSSFTNFNLERLGIKIRGQVIEDIEKAEAIALKYLKDLGVTTAKAVGTGGGASHSNNTKKEAIKLPNFASSEEVGQAVTEAQGGGDLSAMSFPN